MANKMDAAAPEHARRLLKDDPSTLTPADVRELQAMAEGCVQALGLIRAQTWRLLNALKVDHDTAFDEILKRAAMLVERAEPEVLQRYTPRQLTQEANDRFVEASRGGTGSGSLVAGIDAVLRFGIAVGVAVERGQAQMQHEEDDSTSKG